MNTQYKIIDLEIQLSKATELKQRYYLIKLIDELKQLKYTSIYSTFYINSELQYDPRLKNFQKYGISWTYYKYSTGCNCILADEPGLGKTVYVLQFIKNVKKFPILILAPPTLCNYWVSMGTDWMPEYEINYIKETPVLIRNVNIVSYDFAVLHIDYFNYPVFEILVADEVHYLKNYNTRRYYSLVYLKAAFRIGLSGTPIYNSYEELYSILAFLRVSTLPSRSHFYDQFVNPIKFYYGNLNIEAIKKSSRAARQLYKLVMPIIFRRRKVEVGLELPYKDESVILVRMSPYQEKCYLQVLNGNFKNNNFTAFAMLIKLYYICDHPYLTTNVITPSLSAKLEWIMKKISYIYNFDLANKLNTPIEFKLKIVDSEEDFKIYNDLDEELSFDEELTNENVDFDTSIDKVIIFSYSRKFIALLERILQAYNITSLTMTGKCTQQQRKNIIHEFNTYRVYVLITSPRVGGIGLNLTAANYVIISSPSWNPAVDIYASQRTWRFGQTREVSIFRYAAAGTVEERALEKQSIKYLLSDRILYNAFEQVKIHYGSIFKYGYPKRDVVIRDYEEEAEYAIYEATKKYYKYRTEVDFERMAGRYLDYKPFVSESFFPPPIDKILGKMMQIVSIRYNNKETITQTELNYLISEYSDYRDEIQHCYKIVFDINEAGEVLFKKHIMNV